MVEEDKDVKREGKGKENACVWRGVHTKQTQHKPKIKCKKEDSVCFYLCGQKTRKKWQNQDQINSYFL